MLVTFHEIERGTITAAQKLENFVKTVIWHLSQPWLDAISLFTSLFTAIAAHTVKIPSEKNLAIHLFCLRELVDRKVLKSS